MQPQTRPAAPTAAPAPPPQQPIQPQQIPPQPYAAPPQGYPPPPQGYYPPPPGYYPPQGYYQQQPQLTLDERELLADGEISSGQVVMGVVLNGWLGFGLGQAVQGRWSDTGWIFTVGEPLALTIALSTAIGCDVDGVCNDRERTVILGSLLGFFGLRLWSIVDAVTGPRAHNRRVRDLQMRMGMLPAEYSLVPYVMPVAEGGATAGLSLRF